MLRRPMLFFRQPKVLAIPNPELGVLTRQLGQALLYVRNTRTGSRSPSWSVDLLILSTTLVSKTRIIMMQTMLFFAFSEIAILRSCKLLEPADAIQRV